MTANQPAFIGKNFHMLRFCADILNKSPSFKHILTTEWLEKETEAYVDPILDILPEETES